MNFKALLKNKKMNGQTEPQIIDTCKRLTKITAIIGTVIFVLFIISGIKELSIAGLMYIGFAGLINGIFLIALAIASFIHKIYWRKILATIVFMLANIPLSIFYCFIAL